MNQLLRVLSICLLVAVSVVRADGLPEIVRYDTTPPMDGGDSIEGEQDLDKLKWKLQELEQKVEDEEIRHNTLEQSLKQNVATVKNEISHLRGGLGQADVSGTIIDDNAPRNWNMVDALSKSFLMIMVSEIGDETFIIAALMAMRHPRSIVLAGALAALYLMTVLSTALGFVVPNLISKRATHNLATVLYILFGSRLFYIAATADPNEGVDEEIEEVEQKLKSTTSKNKCRQIMARICTPIFLEAFVLTFLAEWGDRSQIATITLAATLNPVGVTIGAIVGHTICTSLAVVGGRLAAMKISQRTVAICGGLTFMAFAIHNLVNKAE